MMRNPRIGNANKIGFDETEDSDDLNPEWENWIDKSGITDKLREMGELQMEGADVYMSTFSQLKQFPFFPPNVTLVLSFRPPISRYCYHIWR